MLCREPDSGRVEPIFVSINDAASILGLSRWTVYQLIEGGEIRSTKHGKRRLVILESVKEYAARLSGESA